MRGLSKEFVNDLKEGKLSILLEAVKNDDTLCLEIRENYINVYYRGGNICKVEEKQGNYQFYFDSKYSDKHKELIQKLFKEGNVKDIVENLPILKYEMDVWFSKNPKAEREFQQLILRENNYGSISNDTDYYIADIEYANVENNSRFDMVAMKWLSTSKERKNPKDLKIAFIEVKYGDNALTGKAGVQEHIKDIYTFLNNEKNDIYQEVEKIINQKVSLNIINISKNVTLLENKPEFILLCANHKPAKTVLKRELQEVIKSEEYEKLKEMCDLKIATASLMGYGLYDQCMISFEDFINKN